MADEKEILISKDNLEDYHRELMASFPKDQIWYGETIPPNNIDAAYVLGVNYSAGKIYYRTSTGWKLISGGSSTDTEKIESKITITRVGSKKVYTSFEETECNISFKWACYINNKSVKVNGDITILVDGAIKETFSATTGTVSKNIREYLNPGSNAVTVKIVDGYNSTSTIDFEATLVNMVVSAAGYSENQFISLRDLIDREKTGWNLNVTVTGGVEKELHMVIDGVEYNWNNLGAPHFQSGPDTLTIEIPIPKLPNAEKWEGVHGTHLVELYAVAYNIPGKPRSNSIFYDMIWWDDVTPCNTVIIASNFLQTEGRQYEMFKIPYYVYKGSYAKTWVRFGKQFIEETDGVKTESEIVYSNEVPQERATSAAYEWVVNSDRIGENIFTIEAGSYDPTTKEFTIETTKRFVLNLLEQEVPDIDINRNLMLFELKASQTNNNDKINREIWKSHDLSEKPIQAIFKDFDWETNGWELIDDRPALKISNGASLEIPYAIFEQPLDSMENFPEYGATISIDVSFSDVSDPEGDFLLCYDEGTVEKPINRGLRISPKRAMLTSGSHTIRTDYENSNSKNYSNSLRFDFVINKREQRFMADGTTPKDKLGSMFLYINGIGASASEYYDDNFRHNQILKINSESCTVHLHSIRVFRKALEPTTILNNWMCDMTTEDKINADYRNAIYNDDGNIVYSQVLERIPCMRIIGPERPTYKGDKKENIDIIFEGTKDGLYDFKIYGVQLDVQGTSSQYYPVKNWKFKSAYKNSEKEPVTRYFETAKGKTEKYALGDDQLPATVFCLKADYMETSSTHNTVTANFANGMYDSNKKTPPQSPRKNKQGIETEAEKERASKTRTTIYGRPIIVFYQKDLESELVFGGKYNFNYDKDAADVFGFLSEDEEYESYEVIDCVEFRENKNERCLLQKSDYTNEFTDNLSAAAQDEYDERSLEEQPDGTVRGYEWGRAFEFRNYYHKDDTGMPYEYLKPATDWILETDYNGATNKDLAEPYIVAKGIASFNYDADLNIIMFSDFNGRNRKSLNLGYSQPEDFDYTIETHFQIQYYEILNEGMENEEIKKTTLEKYEEKDIYINKYGKTEWDNLLNTPTTKTQKPEIYYALAWNEDKKSEVYQFRKDSQNYRLTKFKNELPEHFNEHYCLMYFLLMEMLGMIDSSTKNMFWATWGERHDNHKQKDENGKYKDKVVIWYPIFYDMDTMMGINNVGEMTIPYNVEFDGYEEVWDPEKEEWVKSYYYNGHENVFWNNFRKSYVNELNETFRNKVTSGIFSLNNILKSYEEHSNNFPEAIYNEDGLLKIIDKYFEGFYEASKEEMETWTEEDYNNKIKYPDWMHVYQGDRYYYRRFWLPNRFNYLLSKNFAGTYAGDLISMRLWDPGIEYDDERKLDYDFDIVTWTDQYTRIKYGGRSVTQRCEAYVPTKIKAPGSSYNDTEMAIYGASNLKSIGNISTKYASNLELSAAKRLLELDIGNSHPQYNNANLRSVSFGSNSMLRRVNVENCRRLEGALALESCPNINEINARGTSITGVQLPERGVLKTLLLPDTVTSLVLTNQTKLETFELPSKTRTDAEGKTKEYYGLTKLVVDNVPQNVVNTKVLLEKSIDTLENLYLTGINWSGDKELDNYDLLFQIKAKYENGELSGDKTGDSSTLLRGTVTVKEGQDYLTNILLRFFNNVKDGEELPSKDNRRFDIICRDEKTTHTIIFCDEQGNQIESGIQDDRVLQGQGRPSFSRTPPVKQSEWYNEYQFFCWYTEDSEGNQTLYSDRDIYYEDGTKKEGIKLFRDTPVYSDMIFYPKYFEKPKEFTYIFKHNNGETETPIILAKFDGDEYFNAEGKIITYDYDQEKTSPTIPDNENSDELVAIRYKYWVRENHSEDTINENTLFTLPDENPGETELIYRPGTSTTDTKHRFTFLGWNGKVLTDETILYEGDSIRNIVPAIGGEDARFQSTEKIYTFEGWTLTDVQENTPEEDMVDIPEFVPEGWQGDNKTFIYKAVYSSIPRPYTITFKNIDENEMLQEGIVDFGKNPVYDYDKNGIPQKTRTQEFSFNFIGWQIIEGEDSSNIVYYKNETLPDVKGDTVYKAIFESIKNKYTVTWINEELNPDSDGEGIYEEKTIYSEDIEYGSSPIYTRVTPQKANTPNGHLSFTFNGWQGPDGTVYSDTLPEITENIVYKASYTSNIRLYTIKWYDYTNKGILEIDEDVPWGSPLSYDKVTPKKPEDASPVPNKFSYIFLGWSSKANNADVGENDNTTTYPSDTGLGKVTGNASYYPVFKEKTRKYNVSFYHLDTDTEPSYVESVRWGEKPKYSGKPIKQPDGGEFEDYPKYKYEFKGWSIDTDLNGEVDNNIIYEDSFEDVKGPTNYIAQYKSILQKYPITWKLNEASEPLEIKDWDYGVVPSYSYEDPEIEDNIIHYYPLKGWSSIRGGIIGQDEGVIDEEIQPVIKPTTYYAVFDQVLQTYKITFLDHDGTCLNKNPDSGEDWFSYNYNTVLEKSKGIPDDPNKEGHTFIGWIDSNGKVYEKDDEIIVQGNMTYTANYQINTWKVTFKNEFNPLQTILWEQENVNWNTKILYTEETLPHDNAKIPEKEIEGDYLFVFDGWIEEKTGTKYSRGEPIYVPDEDSVYLAQFRAELREYDIYFYDVVIDSSLLVATQNSINNKKLTWPDSAIGHSNTPTQIHLDYGDLITSPFLDENTINKGYTIRKWYYYDENNKYTEVSDLGQITSSKYNQRKYYAIPTPIEYNIDFYILNTTKKLKTSYEIEFYDNNPYAQKITIKSHYGFSFNPQNFRFSFAEVQVDTQDLKLNFDYWMDYNDTNAIIARPVTETTEGETTEGETVEIKKIELITVTKNCTYKAHYTGTIQTYTITWRAGKKSEPKTVNYGADYSAVNGTQPNWYKVGFYEENDDFKDSKTGKYYAIRTTPTMSSSEGTISTDRDFNAEMYTLTTITGIHWGTTTYKVSSTTYNDVNITSNNSFSTQATGLHYYCLRGINLEDDVFKNGIWGVSVSFKYMYTHDYSCQALLCAMKSSGVAENAKDTMELSKATTETDIKTLTLNSPDYTGTVTDWVSSPAGEFIRDSRTFYVGFWKGLHISANKAMATFTNVSFDITYFDTKVY